MSYALTNLPYGLPDCDQLEETMLEQVEEEEDCQEQQQEENGLGEEELELVGLLDQVNTSVVHCFIFHSPLSNHLL